MKINSICVSDPVRKHLHNIYQKLRVQTRTEAINMLYGFNSDDNK